MSDERVLGIFVGVGESPIDQQGESVFKPGKVPPPAPGTKYRIALFEEHKVKTGETLKSLASSAGITWQELAKFNWGTDDQEEVNKHLHWRVGCTKMNADETEYVFGRCRRAGYCACS